MPDRFESRIGTTSFEWGKRTYLMGIINLSPDSFSGDGLTGAKSALELARQFASQGADILDIGGESTRPKSLPVSVEEEICRVIPAVELIASKLRVPVSIDTYKPGVAEKALEAGASVVNDIWGLKRSPELAGIAARAGASMIIMSNQRDEPAANIMPAILFDLTRGINTALKGGIREESIIVDPGVGFGKSLDQNLEIVKRLAELKMLGKPVLLGTSRKSMIGLTLNLGEADRLEGTAATVAIGIANGADIVRVHDVKAMSRVARMADAIVRRNYA